MRTNDMYLCGYYGMKNSGDDALLLAAAWGAKQYLGAEQLAISSPRPLHMPLPGHFPQTLAKQQQLPGQNRFLQYRTALNSQQVVFGGGSVLHCSRDINLLRHLMLLSGRGPHRAIGVGLGPFKNTRAETACKKFLNECDFVGVRDTASYEIARSLAPNASVSLTFDLAPLLLNIPAATNSLSTTGRRGIGVALCPKERLQGRAEAETPRLKALAESLTECYLLTGEPIFLIDLNGHSELGDSQVHDQLRHYIPGEVPVFRIAYDANPLRLLARLGCLKVVIGMRLHASILAFLAGTPVLSLNYHSKCDGWCEQAGVPESCRFDADRVDARQLTVSLTAGLASGFEPAALQPTQALSAALNNFLPIKQTAGVALC